MKKSIPEYIRVLSDNDFSILEEIFLDKYEKFLELYWLIRNYSENIVSLKYETVEEKDELKIKMKLANVKIDKVMKKIQKEIPDDSNILVWNDDKIIHIKIKKTETVLSI